VRITPTSGAHHVGNTDEFALVLFYLLSAGLSLHLGQKEGGQQVGRDGLRARRRLVVPIVVEAAGHSVDFACLAADLLACCTTTLRTGAEGVYV